MPEDAMLPSVRARGLAGTGRVALYEWSPPEQYDPADPDVWYETNPALGIRISEEFLRSQYEAFAEAGAVGKFCTEHLGAWPDDGGANWGVISAEDWAAAADPDAELGRRPAFCLEMSPDRAWSAICAAWWRPDGLRQVEVIDLRAGVGWLPGRVAELRRAKPCAWLVARDSPASSEVAWMEKSPHRIEVQRIAVPDHIAGAGMLFDGVAGALPDRPEVPTPRTVRHSGQPDLDRAVASALKRPPEDRAWSWDRAAAGAYLLIGVTGALFGLATYGRRPRPPSTARTAPVVTGREAKEFAGAGRLGI